MNAALVDRIARAVLYEGYMLYPYRPSAVKNRQRFNFGVFVPRETSGSKGNSEAWFFQTECLVQARADSTLELKVRFLQIVSRNPGKVMDRKAEVADGQVPEYRLVPALQIEDQLFQAWQEAVEREFTVHCSLSELLSGPRREPFVFSGGESCELLRGAQSPVEGVLIRKWESIAGEIQVAVDEVAPGLFRVALRAANHSAAPAVLNRDRDALLLRSLVSAHAVLQVRDGEFISLLDPPESLQSLAAGCQNSGVWPVLVGEDGARDAMLASPIILYDYPQIAPESPGDLFDGGEIDEILSLRIMTLTDDEKREMRQSDEQARHILERTENLPQEQFMKLHGVLKGMRPARGETR